MARAHIRVRKTKGGEDRYSVVYRIGGRAFKQHYAGVFRRRIDAEIRAAFINKLLVEGKDPASKLAGLPLALTENPNGCHAVTDGHFCNKRSSVHVAGQEYCAEHAAALREFFDESDHVYFARGTNGLIKIGYSNSPEVRVAGLGAELIATERGGCKREWELHHQFRKWRVFGEWFELSPELYAYLKDKHGWTPRARKAATP
jgi:hypothetical protein